MSTFRDIGGCRTAHGLSVRHGIAYRSGDLSEATDDDLRMLDRLTIRLLVDLRSESERCQRPTRWRGNTAPETLTLNLLGDLRAGHRSLIAMLLADPTPAGARRMMVQTYRLLPDALRGALRRLFLALADNGGATLIHCTAGKDRTGFVCACLLHALGVHRDDIYADYLLTRQSIAAGPVSVAATALLETFLGADVSPEIQHVISSVSPEFLDAAFEQMTETHGSIAAWMAASGIDAPLLARLHARMLEDSLH